MASGSSTQANDPAWRTKQAATIGIRVELRLKDGRRLTDGCRLIRTMEAPRGSKRKFAPDTDVAEKFEKLSRHAFSAPGVEAQREAVLGEKKREGAGALAALLSARKADADYGSV